MVSLLFCFFLSVHGWQWFDKESANSFPNMFLPSYLKTVLPLVPCMDYVPCTEPGSAPAVARAVFSFRLQFWHSVPLTVFIFSRQPLKSSPFTPGCEPEPLRAAPALQPPVGSWESADRPRHVHHHLWKGLESQDLLPDLRMYGICGEKTSEFWWGWGTRLKSWDWELTEGIPGPAPRGQCSVGLKEDGKGGHPNLIGRACLLGINPEEVAYKKEEDISFRVLLAFDHLLSYWFPIFEERKGLLSSSLMCYDCHQYWTGTAN